METPSSSSTTSQTASSASFMLSSRKIEELESRNESVKKPQQEQRSALFDITNDSPIIGLAMGSLVTPLSGMSKKKRQLNPGSGEALLRGQVKTLWQKVEEEIALENRACFNLINLRGPTPAKTPQFLNQSAANNNRSLTPQIDNEMITRTLMFDFSDKSDSSGCSSVVTYNGASEERLDKVSYMDDDNDEDDDASNWSIQANASRTRNCYDNDDDDDDGGVLIDEFCEGIKERRQC